MTINNEMIFGWKLAIFFFANIRLLKLHIQIRS